METLEVMMGVKSARRLAVSMLPLAAVLFLGATSAVLWSMRETSSMSADAARRVVRDSRSTDDQVRNATTVLQDDVLRTIDDLRGRAARGDPFAAAALLQIRSRSGEEQRR